MEFDPKAPPIKDRTDVGRLLRAYVVTFPRWIGGYEESRTYDFKFHTQSQRSGDCSRRGYPVVGRQRDGEDYHEFRLKDYPSFLKAWELVKSWDMDCTVEEVRAIGLRPALSVGRVVELSGQATLRFGMEDDPHTTERTSP